MRRQEPPLPQDSVTYVAVLGFLSVCSTRVTLSAIRRNANLICLFLTLYLLSKNLLSLPLTYLVSYLGLPVRINPYTGMIYTTIFIKELIGSLSALSALFITTLACWLASRRALHGKRVFSKPYAGVTSLAVPVIVASSLLGALLSGIFHELTSFFGIILYTNPGYPELPLLSFGNSFFYILLSEILFRGILLARLRRFGDSFAVLAVSLICAFFSSGPVEAISAFLLGLSAGYFTIRAGGSLWPSLIGRLLSLVLLYASRVANHYLDPSLVWVITLLTGLVVVGAALIAYLLFLYRDPQAFRMSPAPDGIPTKVKLGYFCSSFFFLFLILLMVLRVIQMIQIIGW